MERKLSNSHGPSEKRENEASDLSVERQLYAIARAVSLLQQSAQQPQPPQPTPQRQQPTQFAERLQQQLQQIVQNNGWSTQQQQLLQTSRQQDPEPDGQPHGVLAQSLLSDVAAAMALRQQQAMQNSLLHHGGPTTSGSQERKRGRPPLPRPGTSAGSVSMGYNHTNLSAAAKGQQGRARIQQQHPSHQTLTPQSHLSRSYGGDSAVSMSFRQTPTMQNSLQHNHPMIIDAQKRKRGRPPLSRPGTSAGPSAGTSGLDYNFIAQLAAIKNQHEKERMQRENRLQQERQLQIRKQQEMEKIRELKQAQERERQREIQLQQERERQRQLEIERQRKAQHRIAMADIDRERRRQHMIMVKNLEAYKRNEEREKTLNAMMEERNKQNERRIHQKRLEMELFKELRKPVDDMMLKNQKPLPTLNRIPGLKLPGRAFADLLMSYEFIFNFGRAIGLGPEMMPSMNSLQLGLMNLDYKAEDRLIGIMHHLCMCAIKDPRFPYTGSTKEIERLHKSNEGLSQLLHFYLQVITLNANTGMEHESRLYKLIEQKYFLALNATQKAEMLAFICNELLCSQAVTKQMEETIENVAKFRKDKWLLENELRKFRSIKAKREAKQEAEQRAKELAEAAADAAVAAASLEADAVMTRRAVAAVVTNGETGTNEEGNNNNSIEQNDIKKEDQDKKKSILPNGSVKEESGPSKKESDTSAQQQQQQQQSTLNDLDDLEPEMSNDEVYRKVESLTRQYNKTSNKLERAIVSMRANPLGQDRYRRRYWVLPQVGGVFVEGMETSEPEELLNNKFSEQELEDYEKEQQALRDLEQTAETAEEPSLDETETEAEKEDADVEVEAIDVDEKDDEEMEVKEDCDDKDEDEAMDGTNDEEMAESIDTKAEVRNEAAENGGEPEAEEKQAEATTADPETATQESGPKIAWFSILPRPSCDFKMEAKDEPAAQEEDGDKKSTVEEDVSESKTEMTIEKLKEKRHEICPGLAKRLEEIEAEQYESPRKIHPQFQYGWWRITDAQQLKSIQAALHERGSRERNLQKHLTKYFQYACNSCRNNTVDFEITSQDRQLAGKNYGAPLPHVDDDSADEVRNGGGDEQQEEEEEEDEEEEDAEDYEDDTGDDKANVPQATAAPAPRKKPRKKVFSSSVRARRQRAKAAAARKKAERNK